MPARKAAKKTAVRGRTVPPAVLSHKKNAPKTQGKKK